MISAIDKTKSMSETAYERIEEMIVTLEIIPGSIFSETDLSKELNIGRTPVREALQKLTAHGLVATLPRRGMMVTEINIAHHLDLLETRRALERLISSNAARRATLVQREQLKEHAIAIQSSAHAGDLNAFMHADQDFDHLVETASGNQFAINAIAPFHAHCRRFWYYYQINGDLKRAADLHADLMRAIAESDEHKAVQATDALIDYLVEFTHGVLNN